MHKTRLFIARSDFILFFFLFVLHATAMAQPPAHVVLVILENKSYDQIVGNSQAPYINSLLADPKAAYFTSSFALTHPSQPNYLMLFSGANQGVANDNTPSAGLPFTSPNLGAYLLQAGLSFTGYCESMPAAGYTGTQAGLYDRKHNPWVNWQDSPTNGIPAAANQPFSSFPSDFNTLPTIAIVVPNENYNMHNGTIAAADNWLQTNLGAYVEWCKLHNSLFLLTFDEDNSAGNNRILTLAVGSNVAPGASGQQINHYNVLRTLEQLYGLPYAGGSGSVSPIAAIWPSALPLTLLAYTVKAEDAVVKIQWQTASETDISHYTVESSLNGRGYQEPYSVPARNNSSAANTYAFTTVAMEGKTVYRLMEVDRNGNRTVLGYRMIDLQAARQPFTLVLHGISTNTATVQVQNSRQAPITLALYNAQGQQVRQQKIASSGEYRMDLSLLNHGLYFLSARSAAYRQTIQFLW